MAGFQGLGDWPTRPDQTAKQVGTGPDLTELSSTNCAPQEKDSSRVLRHRELQSQLQQSIKAEFGGDNGDAGELLVALQALQQDIGVGSSCLDRLMDASLSRVQTELECLTDLGQKYKALSEKEGAYGQVVSKEVLSATSESLIAGKKLLACQSCVLDASGSSHVIGVGPLSILGLRLKTQTKTRLFI